MITLIDVQNNDKKQIIIINSLGQNIEREAPNSPCFIFYNDASVEKKLIIR